MKNFVVIFLIAFIIAFSSAVPNAEWEAYKAKYNKHYTTSEDSCRKGIYGYNLKAIQEHNRKYESGESTYGMGVNQFADWTTEECSKRTCGFGYINLQNNIETNEVQK